MRFPLLRHTFETIMENDERGKRKGVKGGKKQRL